MRAVFFGIVGAVVGGIVLYFVLDIPRRLATLEGKVAVLLALRDEFNALQNRVARVQDTLERVPTSVQVAALLSGTIGASSRWGSGWLDLGTPTDFRTGDTFRLKIGGTAAKILVRLLPRGISPDSPQGIIGGVITVPENRIVEVSLETDQKNIVQISVHGGPNPWGTFPLGVGNGPAKLDSLELIRR